jgi:polysaccharide chain length determinant protein (PEP-CTERM system associated)
MATPGSNLAGLDLVGVWDRRKWLAILIFSATFALIASVVTFLPDVYRSSTVLMVESQEVPQELVHSTVTGAIEKRLRIISQAVLSQERLQKLITEFGLYEDLKAKLSPGEIVERMRRDISFETRPADPRTGPNSGVAFAITYSGGDPQKVALITNTLAAFFIEEDQRDRQRHAGGTTEFLQSQIQDIKQKLDVQEKQMMEFKERHGGELPEQHDANVATLERLNSDLLLNSDKQIRAREQRAVIEKQLAEASSGDTASRPDAVIEEIGKLNQELTELRRNYSEKYPDVVEVKNEISRLEKQLAKPAKGTHAPTTPSGPYVSQLRASLRSADTEIRVLAAEEANLRKTAALYEKRIEGAPSRQQELQELSRDYQTTKDVYNSMLKRYEEAQIAESMEHGQKGEQLLLLDPAVPSQHPDAPNRPRLIATGMVMALVLAALIAGAAERLDTSFHSLDELRAFSEFPVLASIPRITTDSDALRAKQRWWALSVASVLGLCIIVGASYVVAKGNQRLAVMVESVGERAK